VSAKISENLPGALDVLIVDDVDEMRLLLEELIAGVPGLRQSGSARNTWEARLECQRRRPGLVLLDEVLPGEASLDFWEELKRDAIPVLWVTSVENPQHGLVVGSLGRLMKPTWKTLARDQKSLLQILKDLKLL
jgi:two-component system, CitB family, response regulator CitB